MLNMIVSYLKLQEEYSQKYGDRTVVLMQVGTFYETYEYDPEKDSENRAWPDQHLGHSVEIGGLLNMVVTRKDKGKPYSLTNVDMVGFPMVAYSKHRDVLLGHDFTIVRVDQTKDDKGKVDRFVAEVLSPATQIDNLTQLPTANNIASLFIEVLEESRNFEDYTLAVGLSCVDVTTGENKVMEVYSRDQNNIYPLQEIYRFLLATRPREIVCHLKCKSENYANFLERSLCLNRSVIHVNQIPGDFLKVDYCTRFFSKIFANSKILVIPNIIEDLGLERIYYGMVSYVVLLQFCYEHNQVLIEKLAKPNTSYLDADRFLTLTHNAAEQLELLPNRVKAQHNRKRKTIDSLLSVIDFTQTALGRRNLVKKLTHPIQDISELEASYNQISYLLDHPETVSEWSKLLKQLPDLERYQRKLYLKLVKPHEFYTVFLAYQKVVDLYTSVMTIEDDSFSDLLFEPTQFNECLALVLSKWDIEALALAKVDGETIMSQNKVIYEGHDEIDDSLWRDLEGIDEELSAIREHLNSHLGGTKGKRLEEPDCERLGFITTPHKAKVLMASSYDPNICGQIKTVTVNKDVLITGDRIAQLVSQHHSTTKKISEHTYQSYCALLGQISKYNFFNSVNVFVSQIDLAISAAKSAQANKYYRPKLVKKDKGYCHIEKLRHPVVEVIIDGIYVTNTVTLGEPNSGLLLYGMNSCGKSTLAKAVALNVILAQAGLFVAGEMTLAPYRQIITRLSGHDDLLRGESSFVVEMKELRTILRQADNKTLVVADELCRGTNHDDATSLTVPALETLIKRETCFIFSSHNHTLPKFSEIQALGDRLKICHLSLRYDEKTNSLIYSRELQEGPGDSVYGLEVASSLGLDKEYMEAAYTFRRQLMGEPRLLLSNKTSKYNKKVYMDSCFLCGQRNPKELITHHIKEQHEFKTTDGQQKNVPGNLVELCQKCHAYLHGRGFCLVPVETSSGIVLSQK